MSSVQQSFTCSNVTIEMLVSLFSCFSVSIVKFVQVNTGWAEDIICNSNSNLTIKTLVLLFTCSSASIVKFVQVNTGWAEDIIYNSIYIFFEKGTFTQIRERKIGILCQSNLLS